MAKYQYYTNFKETGFEWLETIPEHWKLTYSKWLFKDRNEKAKSSDEMLTASQKYGVIPQKLFMEMEQQKVVLVFKGHDILKHVEKNDFVISMRSFQGGIEYCNYVGAVSSAYVPLEPQGRISSRYFKYLFKSKPYIQALQATTNLVRDGQALRYSNFLQVHIPVLPFEEAEAIGSFLDHETAQIDTLIDKQQTLIQLLKEKRQAVISHAVTKGLNPDAPMKDSGVEWLGNVPEHWELTKIKYIAELTPSKAKILPSLEKRCSFVPMEKLKLDTLILDETRKIKDVYQGYTYFEDDDVLIAKVTPCFENQNMAIAANLVNGIGFGSSEIYVLRTEAEGLNQFLLYRLQESVFMQLGAGAMTGAGGLRRVPSDFINDFQFALPPINEQQEIVAYIEKMKNTFNDLVYKAEQAIQLMQERRTALISAAVTGKIDVRDWQAPDFH